MAKDEKDVPPPPELREKILNEIKKTKQLPPKKNKKGKK